MKEHIIIPAWQLVSEKGSALKRFNFFPSILATFWLFCILTYQIIFTYIFVFEKKNEALEWISTLIHKSYFNELLIGAIIFVILYILVAPIAEGALIEMIHSRKNEDEKSHIGGFQGIFSGMRHFLGLFEMHNLLSIFKLLSIITFTILLLRLFGSEYIQPIMICMGIYILFAFMANILFAYARFFIIFEDVGALESLSRSTSMSLKNIETTFGLYFTLLLVYLRTIIIAAIFIGLPFVVSSMLTYFSAYELKMLFIVVISVIGCIFFIFIAYLNNVLEIFVEATWYEAYMKNKKSETHAIEEHTHVGDPTHNAAHT